KGGRRKAPRALFLSLLTKGVYGHRPCLPDAFVNRSMAITLHEPLSLAKPTQFGVGCRALRRRLTDESQRGVWPMSFGEPAQPSASELTDFLRRIQAGDDGAARELLSRYEAEVRLVVRRQLPRLLRSRFDSLDFLQSVWGSFFRRMRTAP